MLKVYCYKKCSTCKKAIKWLDNHSIDYKYYEITEERPQEDLFKLWLQDTEKKATYFFNTSGNLYRTMNLKDKLKELSIEEKAKLLADNGMLIKSYCARHTVRTNQHGCPVRYFIQCLCGAHATRFKPPDLVHIVDNFTIGVDNALFARLLFSHIDCAAHAEAESGGFCNRNAHTCSLSA